jgi:hypothetical protein
MRSTLIVAAIALLTSAIVGCGGIRGGGDQASESRTSAGAAHSAQTGSQTAPAIAAGAAGSARSATGAMPKRVLVAGHQPLSDGDADNPRDPEGNPDTIEEGHDGDRDVRTRASYAFPDSDDAEAFTYGHAADAAQRASITRIVERYDRAARSDDGAVACSLLWSNTARAVPATYGKGVGSSASRPRQTCAEVMATLFEKYRRLLQPSVTVVAARVQGSRAEAILGSFTGRASNIFLDRQGSAWRVEQVVTTVLL